MLRIVALAFALSTLLLGCATAPEGKLPPGCSGVPGDFHTPNPALAPGQAMHKEGILGRAVELTAGARPRANMIPLLYIFGPDGEYVDLVHRYSPLLRDPAFVQAAHEAYWGEAIDSSFYWVPFLDKCAQASMFDVPIGFKAPPNGILFMQYIAPSCRECEQITKAIEGFMASNPGMPVRWVRASVPRAVGTLNEGGAE
jgi:hypothetical protein